MLTDEEKKEYKRLFKTVEAHFVQYHIDDIRLNGFTELTKDLDEGYQNIASTFISNISSTLSALNIPFTLSATAAQHQHHQNSRLVSVIESLKYKIIHDITDSNDPIIDQVRNTILEKEIDKLNTSDECQEQLVLNIYKFLEPFTHQEEITSAASSLLYQGAILLWSAFEALSKDLFIVHINKNPHKIKDLIENNSTNKRLSFNKITPETLIEYDFDLTNKMGELVAENQDFSDLETIKQTYDVMFPESHSNRTILKEKDTWILSQKRHLIVHRRGIIDKKYLDKTGEPLNTGEKLVITPKELISYFELIFDCGMSLFMSIPNKSK